MKKILAVFLINVFLLSTVCGVVTAKSVFGTISEYHDGFKELNISPQLSVEVTGALQWLMHQSIQTDTGYKWPIEETEASYYTDLYEGAPGICLLFSEAFQITENETYYHYAIGGINWLISNAVEDNGYKWPATENSSYYPTGFYTGSAGIGSSFIDFYNIFENDSYLHYAEGTARWLIHIGILGNDTHTGTTCKWPSYEGSNEYDIDLYNGATGIGFFFLKLYNVSHNQTYLTYAKYAGNWLMTQAISLRGNCYTWPASPIELSPLKFYFSPGFAHGTASVGDFFAELYNMSKDTRYLHYAEGAGRWLIRSSVYDVSSGGVKWRDSFGNLQPSQLLGVFTFSTGWCHGPSGICKFFIDLYQTTSNPLYLRYAELGAKWLMSVAHVENGNYSWPNILGRTDIIVLENSNPTLCHGVTGIGEFFLELYRITNKQIYWDYANGAANWLKSIGVKNGNGCVKWGVNGQYNTGEYLGVAGIALFLMEMENL
ncbi:MAG: hypothetical protein NT038_10195 [Euryarchaeota archaeon]|nr:hypothetical protein [Euryarchaeota archaeon]